MDDIERIDLAGNSPDFNPIENLWSFIKRNLMRRTISSKRDLIEEFVKIWKNEVPNEILTSLTASMSNRLKEALKNNRGSTKY